MARAGILRVVLPVGVNAVESVSCYVLPDVKLMPITCVTAEIARAERWDTTVEAFRRLRAAAGQCGSSASG